MKGILFLIGLLAAGLLGYFIEPLARPFLGGEVVDVKDVSEPLAPVEKSVTPSPIPVEIAEEVEVTADFSSYSASQLPEKVLLKADVIVTDPSEELKMTITEGNRVDLLRIEGENAVISPGAGPFQGKLRIVDTDLAEQLSGVEPIPEATEAPADPLLMQDAPEELIPREPTEEPEAAADEFKNPIQARNTELSEEEVVQILRDSLENGEISEISADQVTEWGLVEDGDTKVASGVQVGSVTYTAETIFGVKSLEAHAVIENKRVTRWFSPKSGMDIQ